MANSSMETCGVLIYLVGNSKYSLNYQDPREDYLKYKSLPDKEFLEHLKDILHFACIVCWFKERGQYALRDDGVIHQLAHLIGKVNCDMSEEKLLQITRETFNRECELA